MRGGAFARLEKSTPRVRPAARQRDGFAAGARVVCAHKGEVGAVAVGLQHAPEAGWDDALQACCGAAGVPEEDGVASGPCAGPQVSELGPAVAGREIFDRRFIDLHIAAAEHAGADVFVDRAQPVGGQPHPLRHVLAREMNGVPRGENVLLPVERIVVAVFAHDDRREQARRGDAPVLQGLQLGDDRRGVGMIAPHVLAAHDAAREKSRRFVVEQLGDFLADVTPCLGAALHRLGIDDFLDHRQVRRPARTTLTARR
jgi:hypothetical protein